MREGWAWGPPSLATPPIPEPIPLSGIQGGDPADLVVHTEMMLDTDMCLAYTRNGNELHSRSAGGCCAWIHGNIASANLFDTTQVIPGGAHSVP